MLHVQAPAACGHADRFIGAAQKRSLDPDVPLAGLAGFDGYRFPLEGQPKNPILTAPTDFIAALGAGGGFFLGFGYCSHADLKCFKLGSDRPRSDAVRPRGRTIIFP